MRFRIWDKRAIVGSEMTRTELTQFVCTEEGFKRAYRYGDRSSYFVPTVFSRREDARTVRFELPTPSEWRVR